jgi:hypothetical protein
MPNSKGPGDHPDAHAGAEGAETREQRLVRQLRNTATGEDVAGMSTDQIMALLRGEGQPRLGDGVEDEG